jgi:hypothetical protein
MPRVGFESTTTVFEQATTVHDLDRAATVIEHSTYAYYIFGGTR